MQKTAKHIRFNRIIKLVSEIAPHFLNVRTLQVLTKLAVLLALTGYKLEKFWMTTLRAS